MRNLDPLRRTMTTVSGPATRRSSPPASRRVAITVDHPARDLPGLVLTAHALCQAGVTCHLVPWNLAARELWALAPDFVLLNFARHSNEALARALDGAGIRFGVHDTEGGVWPNCEAYRELLWRDAALRDRLACICMWGPRLADDVVAHRFFTRAQVVTTGCPRFDLYHETWRGLLANGGPSPRRPILVATSFALGNPRFATPAQNARQLREGPGWSAERIERCFAAERAGVQSMIELARQLAADYPEHGVVVRPHPFENPAPYRAGLADAPDIGLDTVGPAQPRLAAALAVVQRNSTIAIEAALAGLPVLAPKWVPVAFGVPTAELVSRDCDDYGELRRALDAVSAGGDGSAVRADGALEQVIRDWFLRCDGLAHRRVAEAVLAALPDRREVDERACLRRLAGAVGEGTPAQRAAGELRYRLGLGADFSFRALRRVPNRTWLCTDKAFTADAVNALLARIAETLHARGDRPARVRAAPARSRRDYPAGFEGHAVTLVADRSVVA